MPTTPAFVAPRVFDPTGVVVDVVGAKWEWHFNYPAYGINRYSGTVGRETLVVPTNEAVRFRLISRDVIHEFWVPELRYKHDLIPGFPQSVTGRLSAPTGVSNTNAERMSLWREKRGASARRREV